MARPMDCEPGDYRQECYDDPAPGTGTGNQCPEGSGTTWNPTTGRCEGATTPGGSNCPYGLKLDGTCDTEHTGPPDGGPGEGGPGGGNYDDWPSYFGPMKPTFDFGKVPQFKAPRFSAPTIQDAQNEPGYAFARDEGLGALENSAAARGLARTGGTYKGLVAWGNKFAEQNYGNVFNRALSSFDRLYAGARDEYMPLLTEWQTKAAGTQRAGELEFDRYWQRYLADIDKYKYGNPSATDLLNAELGSV